MPPFVASEALAGLGVQLLDILSLAREKLSGLSDLTLHYDEISLIVRPLSDKTILVLGEPHMNERMVSFSLNLLSKPKPLEPVDKNPVPASEQAPVAVDLSSHIPQLKHGLAKIVGPMADIIFDDAMSEWQRSGAATFNNLLEILQAELGDTQQYERYLALCAETIAEIRQQEQVHG